MRNKFLSLIEDCPSIAGIKDDAGLRLVLKSECRVVFILYGNVLTIQSIVKRLKDVGKMVFVNVDLIDGFAAKDVVVEFVKQHTQADGVLSSKASMIKAGRTLGLLTVHRFFVIDSFSYHNLAKQVDISKPDFVEIMPGCMPKVISWVVDAIRTPLIAGGLVCDHDDAIAALRAGAKAVSSTNPVVWTLTAGAVGSAPMPHPPAPVPRQPRILPALDRPRSSV